MTSLMHRSHYNPSENTNIQTDAEGVMLRGYIKKKTQQAEARTKRARDQWLESRVSSYGIGLDGGRI